MPLRRGREHDYFVSPGPVKWFSAFFPTIDAKSVRSRKLCYMRRLPCELIFCLLAGPNFEVNEVEYAVFQVVALRCKDIICRLKMRPAWIRDLRPHRNATWLRSRTIDFIEIPALCTHFLLSGGPKCDFGEFEKTTYECSLVLHTFSALWTATIVTLYEVWKAMFQGCKGSAPLFSDSRQSKKAAFARSR